MDYFQSSSQALLLTKFLVDWCCAKAQYWVLIFLSIYVFAEIIFISMPLNDICIVIIHRIFISSTDITHELQSYVLSCLSDIHLTSQSKTKTYWAQLWILHFPLTIISFKSLYLCYSCRKWHTKVPLYSVLISNFVILRHWQFQLIPFSC